MNTKVKEKISHRSYIEEEMEKRFLYVGSIEDEAIQNYTDLIDQQIEKALEMVLPLIKLKLENYLRS